jgi:hypothetical protein
MCWCGQFNKPHARRTFGHLDTFANHFITLNLQKRGLLVLVTRQLATMPARPSDMRVVEVLAPAHQKPDKWS